MGAFSNLSESIFGGTDNSAQKETIRQNRAGREYTQEQARVGRSDAQALYGRGNDARNMGYQASLDMLGGSLPVEQRLFQGGNVAAQAAILGGQPNIYQAQLPDYSMYQTQLPDFAPVDLGTPREVRNPTNNIDGGGYMTPEEYEYYARYGNKKKNNGNFFKDVADDIFKLGYEPLFPHLAYEDINDKVNHKDGTLNKDTLGKSSKDKR